MSLIRGGREICHVILHEIAAQLERAGSGHACSRAYQLHHERRRCKHHVLCYADLKAQALNPPWHTHTPSRPFKPTGRKRVPGDKAHWHKGPSSHPPLLLPDLCRLGFAQRAGRIHVLPRLPGQRLARPSAVLQLCVQMRPVAASTMPSAQHRVRAAPHVDAGLSV